MKYRSLALVALLSGFAFTSCGSDDDDDNPRQPSNEEQLSGVWTLNDVSANGTITVFGQTVPFVSTGSTVDPGSYFDFSHSPDQVVDYDASATIDVSAGTDFQFPYQQSGMGSWELKGRDSLIVTEDGRTSRYGILSWTDTRMILRSREVVTFAGQDVNANIEAVIVK